MAIFYKNLANDSENLELINPPTISKGHFGRTRQIKIQIPEGVLAFFWEEDDLIKKFKGVPLKLEIREVGKR